LLEVVARSGYASRDNQTQGVSFQRDHESKAERRIARRTHHDACVASGSVPPTTDLASFAPVPECQDRRRGICCRGHGYSRNVDPAPPTQWLHRPRRRLSLYRFRGSGRIQSRSLRAMGARPLEEEQLYAMASRSPWWCARAVTTPEQCARADENEMRVDRSSSCGFISQRAAAHAMDFSRLVAADFLLPLKW
jgi:hypothetical protein